MLVLSGFINPLSVMMPVTYFAGVTSKAGLKALVPGGAMLTFHDKNDNNDKVSINLCQSLSWTTNTTPGGFDEQWLQKRGLKGSLVVVTSEF